MIGFIGSVFSPWYRWSGRKNPQNHVCINVALYGRGGRWTMTDRGETALRQSPERFAVGPSSMAWEDGALVIRIDERTVPHLDRLRGTIRLVPTGVTGVEAVLKPDESHIWRPFAPTARIEVDFGRPGWQWTGHGYFDANFGTRALEADFSYWTWARYMRRGGTTAFYDADRRDGSSLQIACHFEPDGTVREIPAPPKARIARSLWLVRRESRADPGATPRQIRPMLDAPFYTRAAMRTQLDGDACDGVHEALDLDRFASAALKPMLAVKVPRRAHWRWPD
ncbi:MAG: carotenoid 1,2-hydratase [Pseudomonadota bacterium]